MSTCLVCQLFGFFKMASIFNCFLPCSWEETLMVKFQILDESEYFVSVHWSWAQAADFKKLWKWRHLFTKASPNIISTYYLFTALNFGSVHVF